MSKAALMQPIKIGFLSLITVAGAALYLSFTGRLYTNDLSWKQLFSASARSSTFLHTAESRYEQNFHPNYILDDDPATAWVEGLDGDGEGAEIEWKVSSLVKAEKLKLEIRNGFQKSDALLKKNAAPRQVRITVLNSSNSVTMEKEFALEKKMGWQTLILEPGMFSRGGVATVRLKIVSVHSGTLYRDTCISDIKTYVISGEPYNRDLELRKQKSLNAWVTERKGDAKAGKSANRGSQFQSDDFEFVNEFVNQLPDEYRILLEKDRMASRQLQSQSQSFRLVLNMVEDKHEEDPSSDDFKEYSWAFRQDQFSLFEAKTPNDFHFRLLFADLKLTNIHRSMDSQNRQISAISASYTERVDARGTYITMGNVYITYNTSGEIQSMLRTIETSHSYGPISEKVDSSSKSNSTEGYTYHRFSRNNIGKIIRIDRYSRFPGEEDVNRIDHSILTLK